MPPSVVLTRRTLNRTVLEMGRHWPTVTVSPSETRKAGETWAATFLWRFSYLLYLGIYSYKVNDLYTTSTSICKECTYVVKVVTSYDQSTVHLGRDDGTSKDTTTDGNKTNKWALLVCSSALVTSSSSFSSRD